MVHVFIRAGVEAVELPITKAIGVIQLIHQTAPLVSINRIKKQDYESIEYEYVPCVRFNGRIVSAVHIIKE